MDVSPPLFLIILDITKHDKLKQLAYWAQFIDNCQSPSVTGKAEVILIGSHADELHNPDAYKGIRKSLVKAMEQSSDSVEFIENPILLDCRKESTDELQKVKALLLRNTKAVAKHAELDSRCHVIFSYLYEHYPDIPVKFSDLHRNLRKWKPTGFYAYEEDSTTFTVNNSYLVQLLKTMHCRQHILLIGDTEKSDFWILTAKAQNLMFSNIHGCLFAREDFKKHLEIESNVGVLSSTMLRRTFSDVSYDVLWQFLEYSELCKKIDDKEILHSLIGYEHQSKKRMHYYVDDDQGSSGCVQHSSNRSNTDQLLTAVASDDDIDYFFFPGLVKEARGTHIWKPNEGFSYTSGWCLECVGIIFLIHCSFRFFF